MGTTGDGAHPGTVRTSGAGISKGDQSRAGPLGNGTLCQRRVPTAVAGGLTFDRVTVANWVTCGESTGDRAYCWGGERLAPYAVLGGLSFGQASAGGSHICGKQTTTSLGYC